MPPAANLCVLQCSAKTAEGEAGFVSHEYSFTVGTAISTPFGSYYILDVDRLDDADCLVDAELSLIHI